MTAINDEYEVIDRAGNRVKRRGLPQDGDTLATRMTMMDHTNPAAKTAQIVQQALSEAARFEEKASKALERHPIVLDAINATYTDSHTRLAAIENAKRIAKGETRDNRTVPQPFNGSMAGHRPGSAIVDTAARDATEALISQRDAALCNAWRNPPALEIAQETKPAPAPQNVDDAIAARDRRVSEAWKSPPAIVDQRPEMRQPSSYSGGDLLATVSTKEGMKTVVMSPGTTPIEAVIAARDKRVSEAWKTTATVDNELLAARERLDHSLKS